MSARVSRRDFLLLAGAGLTATCLDACGPLASEAQAGSHDGPLILFQGDSVTDGYRERSETRENIPRGLGDNYPLLIAASMTFSRAARRFRFANRGVGGERVADLVRRWSTDTIALKPDVLSVLVGVNDFVHRQLGKYAATPSDYEAELLSLMSYTKVELPETRLVLMEPFLIQAGDIAPSWVAQVGVYQDAVRRVASASAATFVPLQEMFTQLVAQTGPVTWTLDGVHPTPAGHAAIANQWQRYVEL